MRGAGNFEVGLQLVVLRAYSFGTWYLLTRRFVLLGDTQCLLLALNSVIPLGGAQGTTWDAED